MEKLEILEAENLGITSRDYQRKIADCVGDFLAHFQPSAKTHHAARGIEDNKIPFKVRVHERPPSVQIVQLPQGGPTAGIQRIRNQLTGFAGIQPPPGSLVVARETDLTRECVIVTLADDTVETILGQGLLSPEQVAEVLALLRQGSPQLFVVVQRYIIGIEMEAGLPVPYSVVPESDRSTLDYLSNLPNQLG